MIQFPASAPDLVRQLINTPPSSAELLDAAMTGAPLAAQPIWAYFPIEQAKAWACMVLADRVLPSTGVQFLPFRGEEGRYDVVRARYRAGDATIDIAQTRHVIAVTVAPTDAGAEDVAAGLLRSDAPLHLTVVESYDGGNYGRHDTERDGLISPGWPQWLDALSFFRWSGTIAFVTLKATGGPTRELITADDASNSKWFM